MERTPLAPPEVGWGLMGGGLGTLVVIGLPLMLWNDSVIARPEPN